MLHVNIIILHVDINKTPLYGSNIADTANNSLKNQYIISCMLIVNIIMLHVDLIYLAMH